MAKREKADPAGSSITILQITETQIQFNVVGIAPLIHNRMSQKVEQQLLMPAPRKNEAERQSTLKHRPVEEYQASPYRIPDEDAETLLALPGGAFKKAIASAALDMPGAKKAQIGRLVRVEAPHRRNLIGIYGVPELFMAAVRSADMNRTPDIRTRCIMPEWACRLTVSFVTPIMKEQAIANLLAAAGMIIGVGDGRPEKGALSYGRFRLASANDPEFKRIVADGGRKAQLAAIASPRAYDDETLELLGWYDGEVKRRGFQDKATPESSAIASVDPVVAGGARRNGRNGRTDGAIVS